MCAIFNSQETYFVFSIEFKFSIKRFMNIQELVAPSDQTSFGNRDCILVSPKEADSFCWKVLDPQSLDLAVGEVAWSLIFVWLEV